MPKPEIWLVGDWQASAFAAPRQWLQSQATCRLLPQVADAAQLKRGRGATAVVVAQARAGKFEPHLAELVSRAATHAKLVLLLGPWCEGEHRPVRPLPGVVRVPWRRWRAGLAAALHQSAAAQRSNSEGLDEKSAAAAELERSLTAMAGCSWPGKRAAVWTARRSVFDSLGDALATFSIDAVWLGGSGVFTGAADVIVYDGWRDVLPLPGVRRPSRRAALAARGAPPAGRLLLLDFPRPDDGLAAEEWGIDAILSLPLHLADLAAMLSRLLSTP